ncbi:MAG: hypothetical protein WC699_13670 [Bacteroidales bacterium]|jgi:hypothetical protein
MKINFFKLGVVLIGFALVGSGCNQRPKVQENQGLSTKGQTGVVEVGAFDAAKLKDQIVEIIQKAPKLRDIPRVLNRIGASYMAELTLPINDVEKYLTAVDMSLANGIYAFDAVYAKVLGRDDVVAQLLDIHNKMIAKLGLEGELAIMKKYDERIKQNSENHDSLSTIVMDAMNELSSNMTTEGHSGVYALFYVASNIEGLYILTQTAKMAKDDTPVIEFIGDQKERIKTIFSLLELTGSDPSVAPILEKMKPIMNYFNNNNDFSAKQLEEVTPLIEQLRQEIVK